MFLVGTAIIAYGGFGGRAQYYYTKGIYRLFNPSQKPSAEIVIDLKKDHEFIMNHSKPTGWLYRFNWWPERESLQDEGHLGLQTGIPSNPFEYFTVKIILDDTTRSFLMLK